MSVKQPPISNLDNTISPTFFASFVFKRSLYVGIVYEPSPSANPTLCSLQVFITAFNCSCKSQHCRCHASVSEICLIAITNTLDHHHHHRHRHHHHSSSLLSMMIKGCIGKYNYIRFQKGSHFQCSFLRTSPLQC
jgi:hypothetical protein